MARNEGAFGFGAMAEQLPRHARRRRHGHGGGQSPPVRTEPTECVLLDRYNSDLNLEIDDSGVKAHPLTTDGFAYMWAGARATHGVRFGKMGFEVKILKQLDVRHLPSDETSRHVVRVGFSTDTSSTQLGEEPFSCGYGGTGKASQGGNFRDFGGRFGLNDVIGCHVDFDSDPITISFSKNGNNLGKCFIIPHGQLRGRALFPHVYTKNCEFECNFGQKRPWFHLQKGYEFIQLLPVTSRIRGALPPATEKDCEMIMMCGLPGCGKTTWADKHARENPAKKYNILGTNNIMDSMKVTGLPRRFNYGGRWDVLIDKATKCLNELLNIAARHRRNYILDQTNVYPSAQNRKMGPFAAFRRKAVVIVPTDDEFRRRIYKRKNEEGKEVPNSEVLKMKANFQIPDDRLFDAVEFVELPREQAVALVRQYNREGQCHRSTKPSYGNQGSWR